MKTNGSKARKRQAPGARAGRSHARPGLSKARAAYPSSRLARLLRATRLERDLSQIEAAKELGIHWRSLTMWECGHTTPALPALERIATWAGIELAEAARLLRTSA